MIRQQEVHQERKHDIGNTGMNTRLMPFRPLFPCVPIDQVISASQRTQGNKG